MKLTINSQRLAQELRLIAKVIASKSVIPILSHVILRAEDILTLSATDLEVSLQTTCPADITLKGCVALPALRLLSMVEHFADRDVIIAVEKSHVLVSCGAFHSKLQTLSIDDFPQLTEPNGIPSTLNARRFQQLVERTRYVVAENDAARLLRGALFTLSGSVAAMVAVDGKRLALTTMSREGADVRVVIPAKMLDLITQVVPDGDVEVTIGTRHLFFKFGERLYTSRMLDGEFPAYERIIPRTNDKKLTIDRGQFIDALKRVGLASSDNKAVTMKIGSVLELSARSADVGSADEEVTIEYDGPALTLSVNGDFIVDFLNVASNPRITLAINDEKSPLLMLDGESHLGVVMTMRN